MQKPKTRKVKSAELTIDLRVQREIDQARIRAIKKDFNLNAIGTLCVSDRGNGEMVVIDGGHRKAVLDELNMSEVPVNAEVYEGLVLADEAALFRLRNNTQKVGYMDRFRVRLVEGEPNALAVEALAKKHGWGVPGDEGMPLLYSVRKLEQLYERSEDLADLVLQVTTTSWGHNPTAVDHRILGGLAMFLNRYWNDVDISSLEHRLATYNGGPEDLIVRAQSLREIYRATHASGVAEIITDTYNKGKKTGGSRLASWRA